MPFQPTGLISHLIRDRQTLVVRCECGREVRPDLIELRSAMWRRFGGNQDKVALAPQILKCSVCGSKEITCTVE